MNASFHKSWKKVKDASIVQLLVEQLTHYITTYGFESMGVYDESTVYIPTEELDVPNLNLDELRFVVIKGYSKEEIKEKLLALLETGIALKEETIDDVVDVALYVGIDVEDLERVNNREVRITLYDYLDIIPRNPTEFLRFVIFKTIDSTLLIKNE